MCKFARSLVSYRIEGDKLKKEQRVVSAHIYRQL